MLIRDIASTWKIASMEWSIPYMPIIVCPRQKKQVVNNLKYKSQQTMDYKRLEYNSWAEDSI